MSDNTPTAQEIYSLYLSVIIENYTALCPAVLVLYDYFLTFPLEVSRIWHGNINAAKVLFVLNRYASLASLYSFVALIFYSHAVNTLPFSNRCQTITYFSEISFIVTNFAISGIFTLRTFAIYGRNWIVFFLLAIPGLLNVASGIWQAAAQTAFAIPPQLQESPVNCGFSAASSLYTSNLGNIVSLVSSVIFDVLVVILTVSRTARLARLSRKAEIGTSLSFILLRDGILYYVATFFPTLVALALNAVVMKTDSFNVNSVSNDLSDILNGIQVVMVNRLVLNLSQAASAREDSEFRSKTGLEPPVFVTSSTLGNIGGPVRTIPDDLEDCASEEDTGAGDEKRLFVELRGEKAGSMAHIDTVPMSGTIGLDSSVTERFGFDIEEIQA